MKQGTEGWWWLENGPQSSLQDAKMITYIWAPTHPLPSWPHPPHRPFSELHNAPHRPSQAGLACRIVYLFGNLFACLIHASDLRHMNQYA